MRFTLVINLDRDEIERDGIDAVLTSYLADVAIRIATGAADAGTVWTENGNGVGRWITDDDGEYDLDKPRFVLTGKSVPPMIGEWLTGKSVPPMIGEWTERADGTLAHEMHLDDSDDNAAQFQFNAPGHVDTDERPLPDDGV